MRNFELFLDVLGDKILIGNAEQNDIANFSTYNEELSESENSQFSLSFSIVTKKYKNDYLIDTNPLLSYYFIGAKLYLILDYNKEIDFIIKDIQPSSSQNSAVYQITAQDEVSYMWSRHNLGYSYSTLDRKQTNSILTPKNIYDIAAEVLEDNFLYSWTIIHHTNNSDLEADYATLEISDSNPYNVIIEACNTLNALLYIDYRTKSIDFYRKNRREFSGYRYNSNINAINYEASHSGEELATILHVSGGTDANDNAITIIPPMPQPVRKYIQEEHYISNGKFIADSFSWSSIKTGIENNTKYFSKINLYLTPISGWSEDSDAGAPDKKIGTDYIYTIKFDYVTGKYEGVITFAPTANAEDSQDIIYTIDTTKIFTNNGTYRKCVFPLKEKGGNIAIFIDNVYVQNLSSALLEKEKKELQQFFAIVEKVPYLGQSLIDFSIFKPYMTPAQREDIDTLINVTLRDLNIALQYYLYDYYFLTSELTRIRARIKNYGENYITAYDNYRSSIQTNAENIDKLKQEAEDRRKELEQVIVNSHYIDLLNKLGKSDSLEITEDITQYFQNRIAEQQKLITTYQTQLTYLAFEDTTSNTGYVIDATNKFNYYNNLIKMSRDYVDMYQQICNILDAHTSNADIVEGVAIYCERIEHEINHSVMHYLYHNYGQFIYEQTYNNTDELNSIDLFNQAYSYFQDINRFQSSYSLEVLDIGQLERVSIPRLSIGSLIEVQNKNSIQSQPYAYILSQIEKEERICRHYKTIDSKLYEDHYAKLENAREYLEQIYKNINGIDKEKTVEYSTIINEIYSDRILVTGINRVLRAPLKDSVTVEQTSRYKTILSKLIKSI